MKQIFFTPGPAQLYPSVARHLKIGLEENIFSISHRSQKFKDIYEGTVEGLIKLLKIPDDYKIVFVASATEAMERLIENIVEKKSFHFVNGSFGKRWQEIAVELKRETCVIEIPFGEGFKDVPEIPKDTELICFTHNETSSGVALNTEFIYKIGKANPKALLAVDTVSSAPYIDIDFKRIDAVFFSVQKLFGLPAGLGVMILSPKAIEKATKLQKKGLNIGSYHNLPSLVDWAEKNQTIETPSVLHIYLLGKVLEDMNKKDIKKIREELDERAKLIYDFFDNNTNFKPFVKNKKDRSQTVIVITLGDKTEEIKAKLEEKGLIVGGGYGPFKNTQIRIANFPAVGDKDISVLINEFKKF
ncbi:MAG TPA: aminotransferase class V-fold PLP-dependent enzyme [Patescibacteria group bacterium]